MNERIRILFVCHGNICRSPMAEYVFAELASQRGLLDKFEIASAATSTEELGNDVYPHVRRMLAKHDIPCPKRTARQVRPSEAAAWDYFICMDDANVRNLRRMLPSVPTSNIVKLMAFTDCDRKNVPDVSDPWYSRDFETCYSDVLEGCRGLLDKLA